MGALSALICLTAGEQELTGDQLSAENVGQADVQQAKTQGGRMVGYNEYQHSAKSSPVTDIESSQTYELIMSQGKRS
jgi:hypothetical protein